MQYEGRATCYRCFRPRQSCYCKKLSRIANRTRVIVLQHPRERFHPLGTARIAKLSLTRCDLVCAAPQQVPAVLKSLQVSPDAALLFPAPDATPLEDLSPGQYPSELIVLDGTWHHAKVFLRDVPDLLAFRRVRFSPPAPSAYRIRREPDRAYLSTVESIVHVLGHLEPETSGLDRVLHSFHFMIDRNIALRRPQPENARFVRKREALPHRFPALLLAARRRMVVFYCEGSSRTGRHDKLPKTAVSSQPLVVYLRRLDGTDSRRIVLRTGRPVSPKLLKELAMSQDVLDAEGLSAAEAREALEEELMADDIVVVCNASSHRILRELGVAVPLHLELKGVYCDYQRFISGRVGRDDAGLSAPGFLDSSGAPLAWGGIEQVLRRHGIPDGAEQPWTASSEGRGALRLRQTLALFECLRRLADDHLRSFV